MKLLVPGILGLMLSAAMSVGCGPGLSHRAKAPEPPTDVFNAMDAELAHAMIGTTTVTSAEAPLPESRLPLAPWDDTPAAAAPVVAVTPTWGANGELAVATPAGAAPAAEPAAAAAPAPAAKPANDFDMHPYD
jgi:hypothetical protein